MCCYSDWEKEGLPLRGLLPPTSPVLLRLRVAGEAAFSGEGAEGERASHRRGWGCGAGGPKRGTKGRWLRAGAAGAHARKPAVWISSLDFLLIPVWNRKTSVSSKQSVRARGARRKRGHWRERRELRLPLPALQAASPPPGRAAALEYLGMGATNWVAMGCKIGAGKREKPHRAKRGTCFGWNGK